MKKKWLILFTVFLGSYVPFYFLFLKVDREKKVPSTGLCIKKPYFEPVKITEFSDQIPCVEVEIEGKKTTAILDLGCCADIELPSEILKELDQKSFLRCASSYGIRGKRYYSDVYEIPKMKMGGMSFYRARAEELNLEFEKDATLRQDKNKLSVRTLGRIGWKLFYKLNILLDCENSGIAFCDSLDTLRKQGYPVDDFIEAPLLLDRNFIEFEVMTEVGPLRCILDTGSTWNILNKDLEGGCNDHRILTPENIDEQFSVINPENVDQMVLDPEDSYSVSVFKIGGKDFGAVTFQKIKTPFEVDAIIGMEFLDSKLVFIDFPNRKIYFY